MTHDEMLTDTKPRTPAEDAHNAAAQQDQVRELREAIDQQHTQIPDDSILSGFLRCPACHSFTTLPSVQRPGEFHCIDCGEYFVPPQALADEGIRAYPEYEQDGNCIEGMIVALLFTFDVAMLAFDIIQWVNTGCLL